MNKIKLLWVKLSLGKTLYLGFIVFGIGCITWAIFSMWAQNHYSADATSIRNFIPTTLAAKQNKLMRDIETPVELDKSLYPVYPIEGDDIGSLTIPALNRKLPIIQGTGVEELKKGVGHFIQSVLPGEKDNCVLSGHRDTVFRQIGNLKIGDQLIVKTSAGSFTYQVNGTRIVHQDDKTVIVSTNIAVLTLTTCYPFYAIGNAPDRYIVSAALVKSR